MKVGVVIPAYNAEAHIGAVLSKVHLWIPKDRICVIDDGSYDRTSEIAKSFEVHCLRFHVNQGKGEALKAGFDWVKENALDAVITLDADGQHDPDLIPEFMQTMQIEHSDVVLGTRRFRLGEMPPDRVFSNKVSSFFVSLAAHQKIHDSQCGFRMFRSAVLRNLTLNGKRYELESEMLIRLGRRRAVFSTCAVQASYTGAPSHIRRLREVLRFIHMWFSLIFERKDSG